MVDQLSSFASEVTRVAREVGTEGKLGGQADVQGVAGTWKDLTDNVNFMEPVGEKISTCASTESIRSRTSFWKPFMTDSTTISAITPSAMPTMEAPEMKLMKRLRRPPRPART